MNEWFDTTLVAISFVAEGRGYWSVLELPARSTRIQTLRGKFPTQVRAEQVIEDQYGYLGDACITVDPMDLIEEVARRNAFLSRLQEKEYE